MINTRRMTGTAIVLAVLLFQAAVLGADRKSEYVEAVTRGAGFMPWQERGVSREERDFRREIEARKDRMLAERATLQHPAILSRAELERAKRNIRRASWARDWLARQQRIADHVVAQPDGYVEAMIPELTPWFCYGMTCPNCVGKKSQEAMGDGMMLWRHTEPEVLTCRYCGQQYPSPDFPETGKLVCPRSGQTLTFYLNEEERRHREDRSGRHGWHWCRRPTHVSFRGAIRARKAKFMIRAARSLALTYQLTGDARYAEKAVAILVRLAHCYRHWLYHDYWDTVADCDPMYAAWHDRSLRLEWKRHLCTAAYGKDTVQKARMLRNYWGAGRLHPSCDAAGMLTGLSLAYDLVHDATNTDGKPLWTPETRAAVERDLLMEWLMGGEPFLGGAGKATNVNNKSGRVYHPMARVAKCLGITAWADTALSGFEALQSRSLAYDGFSHESPGYTFSGASYLGNMIGIAEALHGFRWPKGYGKRSGEVNLYRDAPRFRLLMRAMIDCLRPDGFMPPLSDTAVRFRPSINYLQAGLKRLPEHYAGALKTVYPGRRPSEYAVLRLDAEEIERTREQTAPLQLPEIYFPAWMTAILRHGAGPDAAMLTLHFSPPGGHRHADSLSVYYRANGHTLLGDHGYVCDTPMNGWIKHTLSHNLVVVDGRKQSSRKPPRVPRLYLMATTPKVSVVEASAQTYAQCSEYRRLVALIKGPGCETFAVDVFRVEGGERHAFRVFSELAASDAVDSALRFDGIALPPEPPLPQVGKSTRKEDIFGLRDVRNTTDVPPAWQAVWQQNGAAYRLRMLSEVHAVEASNGPGQETGRQAGRRVRYLDAVRSGTDLASVFVAVHEPAGSDGSGCIRHAERVVPPMESGPDAVALRVDCEWGTHWIFLAFDGEGELDGIRFRGDFGVFCRVSGSTYWLMGLGAATLQSGVDGFSGRPGHWRSAVANNTAAVITSAVPRPAAWPVSPKWCRSYVLAHDGKYHTGFPVRSTAPDTLTVERFPLPRLAEFDLPALRYVSVAEMR